MTKVCTDDFKKEDYPPGKLHSDGFSIHEWLKENYDVCIKAVHKDLDFVFIVSGNGFVRVGKSLVAMQGGYYITKAVNKMYGVENKFNLEDNYAYNANELIRKAMKLPKYSVIILDEGDDLEENYWSYLAKVLRRFFRKCGQKNLFIFMVVPDFFELKKAYAITRSIALINVKFEGEFERGNFQFFGFKKKKELYVKGKRYSDYDCVNPDFEGEFTHFYPLNEEEYRARKQKDMEEDDKKELADLERGLMLKLHKRWVKGLIKRVESPEIDPPLTNNQKSFLLDTAIRRLQKYKVEMRQEGFDEEYSEGEEAY